MDNKKPVSSVHDEIADILIVLIGLANVLRIDMATALHKKEETNRQRTWK